MPLRKNPKSYKFVSVNILELESTEASQVQRLSPVVTATPEAGAASILRLCLDYSFRPSLEAPGMLSPNNREVWRWRPRSRT